MTAAPRNGDHLFVYGTLRSDVDNSQCYRLGPAANLIDSAFFTGRLYDVGSYPAAIVCADGYPVRGQLYHLSSPVVLITLDRYENCDATAHSEYRREKVLVKPARGEHLWAWVYLYNQAIDGFGGARPREIFAGDYARMSALPRLASPG